MKKTVTVLVPLVCVFAAFGAVSADINPTQITITPTCASVGSQVTITVTGSQTGANFKYWVRENSYCVSGGQNQWTTIKDWSTDTTATWTPTSPRRKTVVVWVTDDVSSDCIGMIGASYEVGGANCIDPARISLSPAAGNVNEAVTLTVTGSESDLLYRFWVNNDPFCSAPVNPDWEMLQDWSANNTCTWTPTGNKPYTLIVWTTDDTSNSCTGMGGMTYRVGAEVLEVTVYDREKAYVGTTIFSDLHDLANPRVVEVNMEGSIIWEYYLPDEMAPGGAIVGFEAELLPNDNVLLVISGVGLYEVDRSGNIVWSLLEPDVSHDAEVLPGGNVLYNFGNNEGVDDPSMVEVKRNGEVVREWYLKDHYLQRFPVTEYSAGGWGHCNAVQRLSDGTTMVSIRNFWLTTIIDEAGDIVKEYDWSGYGEPYPHEPQMYENDGSLIVCLQNDSPYAIVRIDAETGEELWTYPADGLRTTRDGDLLPNGNILLTTVDTGGTSDTAADDISKLIEVTPAKEIVWELQVSGIPVVGSPGFFFKAERFGPNGERVGSD